MADEPSVRITLADIYKEVVSVRDTVAPLAAAVPDHESRLRRLEAWMYAIPASVVLGVASVVVAAIR